MLQAAANKLLYKLKDYKELFYFQAGDLASILGSQKQKKNIQGLVKPDKLCAAVARG